MPVSRRPQRGQFRPHDSERRPPFGLLFTHTPQVLHIGGTFVSMLCALHAFVPVATSFGWVWGHWGDEPLAEESLISVSELPRVLRSYAATVAMLIRGEAAGDRFNVTAYGRNSGLVYGRDQWAWDSCNGRYVAHGEPWVPRTAEDAQDVPLAASNVSQFPSRTVSAHGPRLAA